MDTMKIKESIVVEGRHDEARLKEIIEADIVVTNGSHLRKETLAHLKDLNKRNGIIIFTDPDNPGKRLRQRILDEIPSAKQAFLAQKDARHKRKVGIEHASKEVLLDALKNVIELSELKSDLTMNDLVDLNLSGNAEASHNRNELARKLNLSEGNAKQFLKQCHHFGLSKKDLIYEETD